MSEDPTQDEQPQPEPKKKRRSPERRVRIEDVPMIKGMVARGDMQSDVAAYFGLNGGRPSDVSKNKSERYVPIAPAPPEHLPPPGPYLGARSGYEAKNALLKIRSILDKTLAQLAEWEGSNADLFRQPHPPKQPKGKKLPKPKLRNGEDLLEGFELSPTPPPKSRRKRRQIGA